MSFQGIHFPSNKITDLIFRWDSLRNPSAVKQALLPPGLRAAPAKSCHLPRLQTGAGVGTTATGRGLGLLRFFLQIIYTLTGLHGYDEDKYTSIVK